VWIVLPVIALLLLLFGACYWYSPTLLGGFLREMPLGVSVRGRAEGGSSYSGRQEGVIPEGGSSRVAIHLSLIKSLRSNLNKCKKKILCHNMTFKGIEVVPGVLNFDQRGVICAEKGDVIVTKSKIDPEYLAYLESLGWNFEGCRFLTASVSPKLSYDSLFYDQKLIAELSALSSEKYILDTYNLTRSEREFANKIAKNLWGNSEVAEKYGTKSGFRKLARELTMQIPPGFERVYSTNEIIKKCSILFNGGAKNVVIKIDEGVSGAGASKISLEEFQKASDKQKCLLAESALLKVAQAQENSGVVVEEWVPDILFSPSLQINIDQDKKWQVVSSHDQILGGREGWYEGCSYPARSISSIEYKTLQKDIKNLTERLIEERFFGFLGLDLIKDKKSHYYWVEANIRKTGTFYPGLATRKIRKRSSSPLYYFSRDFTVPSLVNGHFKQLRNIFRDLKYSKTTESGVVIFNTGALSAVGRFDILCIGNKRSQARSIYYEVLSRVNQQNLVSSKA